MPKTEAAGRFTTSASSNVCEATLSGINRKALEHAKFLLAQTLQQAAISAGASEIESRRCDCGCERARTDALIAARMAAR